MKRKILIFISLILLCLLVFFIQKALYNYNFLYKSNHIVNIYLDNTKYTPKYLNELKNADDSYAFVFWNESDQKEVTNKDFLRTTKADVFYIYGDSSFLLDDIRLFDDNKDSCMVGEDVAYELFGSLDVEGREIDIDDRQVEIESVSKKYKDNIFLQCKDSEMEPMDGASLLIPKNEAYINTDDYVNTFIMKYGLENVTVDSDMYNIIAALAIFILFIIISVVIIYYTFAKAIKYKQEPVKRAICILAGIILIIILWKYMKIKFEIPLNIIPNKWSDFEKWTEIYKQYSKKVEFFICERKYCIDNIRMKNTISVIWNSFFACIMFWGYCKCLAYKKKSTRI